MSLGEVGVIGVSLCSALVYLHFVGICQRLGELQGGQAGGRFCA